VGLLVKEQAGLKPAGAASRLLGSPWAILVVVAAAVALRAWGVSEWSLWEDEETSVYFSQQLGKPFPRFFPLFFLALNGLYQLTGVSVAAGRMLAAAFGIASIGLVYATARRQFSREIALLASLLLALNLGHLFWSQSIRYFTLLFVLELLSMYWFLEGFERGKIGLLLLSNLAFALALWTHFSALLLMPVYVAYLFFMLWGRQSGGAYNLRGYLIFAASHGAVLGLMALQFVRFHGVLKGMADPTMQDPLHLSILSAAYFGVPVIALALLAPFVAVNVPRRIVLFFVTAGVLPVLELIVIAGLHLSNVTWYYGFFAFAGFSIAAGVALVSLYQRGYRWSARLGGAAALLYAVPLLAGYYTTMYGDRPRWKDACHYLLQEENVHVNAGEKTRVFATVPGVVAFYLGVPPGETMNNPFVREAPDRPPSPPYEFDQWYVVESGHATPAFESWLHASCTLRATFPARTGPRDRSIHIYYCPASSPEHSSGG
jgi:hypothetical protein